MMDASISTKSGETRPLVAPTAATAPSEDSTWDGPLFEAEVDDIERAETDGHDEVVGSFGALWDRLATLDHESRKADDEHLEEAFTHTSLDIRRAKLEPTPTMGPSRLVSPWHTLRRSLIRLLDRACEQGYLLRERLMDHLPEMFASESAILIISGWLADQGVELLEEPPPSSELLLDSPAVADCGWDDVIDEELAPGSDAWEDIDAIYFRQATAVPLLSRDEERNLAKALEQARLAYLRAMTSSRPSMEILRDMLAEVQARHIRAHQLFDWLPERPDRADGDDETLEPGLHFYSTVQQGSDDPLAPIRANCCELTELLASGFPAGSRKQAAIPSLQSELVGQLGEARFSGYAMSRLVQALAARGQLTADPEDLAELLRAATAHRTARDRLIGANLRLVMWIARRYRGVAMPLSDLIQEGNLALMRAVDRFDHRRDARFSTYATWWIRQGITRGIGNDSRVVRLPVHVHESLSKVKHAHRHLDAHDGKEPSPAQIAERVGLPESRVSRLLAISSDAIYLDPWDEEEAIENDDETDSRTRADVRICGDAFEAIARLQTAEVVGHVLSGLLPREAKILRMRFGIGGDDEQTLEEIGRKFGLTRERIRQLETKGLQKLRHPVRRLVLENLTDGVSPGPRWEVIWERSDPGKAGGNET